MKEEVSECTRNGFQTEITLTTQRLLAFISAFEKMVSSSSVHWWKTTSNEDSCVWRRSAWESWQRSLNCSRATVHVMGSNQSSVLRVLQEQNLHAYDLQKVQGLGPTTSHLLFDLSNGFCNGASWILPFLHKSCLLMRPASQDMATSTAETATSRTTRIRSQYSSEFTRRDSM